MCAGRDAARGQEAVSGAPASQINLDTLPFDIVAVRVVEIPNV